LFKNRKEINGKELQQCLHIMQASFQNKRMLSRLYDLALII